MKKLLTTLRPKATTAKKRQDNLRGDKSDKNNKPPPTPTNPPKEKDPTRYGDWVSKGRCVDF